MRQVLLIAALGAALIPTTATAKPRVADPCAALQGRDLAPGKAQRAVRRGSTLRFCVSGGKVRRLGGGPVVHRADGTLLLLHRRGTVEALDMRTGRRAPVGPLAQIVHARPVDSAGVVAVRRTAAGDAVIVAAPGRAELVIDQRPAPVESFSVTDGVTWTRAGLTRSAQLPLRALRCGDLRGFDHLAGPERIVSRGRGSAERYVGCAGAPDAATFVVGGRTLGIPVFAARAGSWLLLDDSSGGRFYSSVSWRLLDLATGRSRFVAAYSGGAMAEEAGDHLLAHVLLADGRLIALTEEDRQGEVGQRSMVSVLGPDLASVVLDETQPGAPKAENLRLEDEMVRWTVGGEERSAPLPALG